MQYWRSILTSFLVFLIAPCAAEEQPLRLATLEYPPYITNTERGAQGLVVDVVNMAFSRIGQPIQIEFFPVARGQVRLLNGQADAFFSIKKTQEREQTMLFTQRALMSQDYVFFVRKDSPWRFSGSFDSLADASIGVVGATSYGSLFDTAVQAGVFKKLEPVTSHETNFRKLLARRIDAVICSRLVGLYYLDLLNGLGDVDIRGPVVETTFSYLVFTKQRDFTALSRQFDQALDAMEHDGSLKRLINAYTLPQARTPSK
jgi:polar amino acid transport system substrate-binding protein